MIAKFYLGSHHPSWLADPNFADVPLFVSSRRLQDRKTLPAAVGKWALDSGGFSEIKEHGRWTITPAEYVALVRWYAAGIGMPDFVAPQDWMCEPWVIRGGQQGPLRFAGTREARGIPADGPDEDLDDAIFKHQTWTVANFLELRGLAPELPWMPVLQGWRLADYVRCADMYAAAGVDLAAEPIVGLGSVCRRQATEEIAEIVATFADRDLNLHGFGVKTDGLGDYGNDLVSADSMAWSVGGRRTPTRCGSTTHKNEANCPEYALAWRDRVLGAMARGVANRASRGRQPRLFEVELG